MTRRDTIAAIATAPGRAGIGVVRVSGSDLEAFAERLTGRHLTPRFATLTAFRDAAGSPIDRGIALFFKAPDSYTGEDVLELQGHGGPVVLRLLLQRCLELGARVAEPGGFTQRAFLNGKLDLVQAEGIIDLIDAGTAQAARSAMRSLEGEFSSAIQALSTGIVELRALVEATLDFPEEDIDVLEHSPAAERLQRLVTQLDAILDAARQGSLLRDGLHVVFAGRPNVGKSSLLNRLAGEELAIVTDVPGTTRDPIRQLIDLDGVPAHVIDTAGLRESTDPVERIGVERAWGEIRRADVVVLIAGAGEPVEDELDAHVPDATPRIRVINKIDLAAREPEVRRDGVHQTIWLSARTGAGVPLLRQALLEAAGWRAQGETVFLARERHLRALQAARTHLHSGREHLQVELFAEELRLAHHELGSLTGEFTADDLLGEIFQRFCIGK
jgi:tRNA modification GTPase